MMYAYLFGLEKFDAMRRWCDEAQVQLHLDIPPSPEYIALNQTKESDWLAAEIECGKGQARAVVVWIVVILLVMFYGWDRERSKGEER